MESFGATSHTLFGDLKRTTRTIDQRHHRLGELVQEELEHGWDGVAATLEGAMELLAGAGQAARQAATWETPTGQMLRRALEPEPEDDVGECLLLASASLNSAKADTELAAGAVFEAATRCEGAGLDPVLTREPAEELLRLLEAMDELQASIDAALEPPLDPDAAS